MKTSDLIGPALDWAVAKAEKIEVVLWNNEDPQPYHVVLPFRKGGYPNHYAPSTNWAQGGPIIDREFHAFDHMQSDCVCAMIKRKDMRNGGWNHGYGPTSLIAAMRCYVASKLGDEIEIPEKLK